jgi:hypothetical protein
VLRNKRGQIRIIEAFLSMLVLFSALTICSALFPPSDNNRQDTLASCGVQALIQLDRSGELDMMLHNENWTTLSDALKLLLPVGVSYNLTVFDESHQEVNGALISRGYLEGDVVAVDYVCVGQRPQLSIYTLRLQLMVVK